MLSSQLHAVEAIRNLRLQAASDARELANLRIQATVSERIWLAQRVCSILVPVGHLLIVTGRWLQDLGLPGTSLPSVESNATG
jgi:hypothetical protein